jgi:hypothetical protein
VAIRCYDINGERIPKIRLSAEAMCKKLCAAGLLAESDEFPGVFEITEAGEEAIS